MSFLHFVITQPLRHARIPAISYSNILEIHLQAERVVCLGWPVKQLMVMQSQEDFSVPLGSETDDPPTLGDGTITVKDLEAPAAAAAHVTNHGDTNSTVDEKYFSSYEDLDVHSLMLKDKPRTLAYKHYIENNPDLFKDKVVLDVGAGTGILSLFAAKAGAKQVYAIEASQLSHVCQAIADHNGFKKQITVLHGRAEDIYPPENVKADVIISEWMGFYLVHESMLNSVIVARDRWLAPDGILAPSSATLYLCPVSMKEYKKENIDFWKDVYGFDFSPLLPSASEKLLTQPVITEVKQSQCLSEPELVTHLELAFLEPEDIKVICGVFKFKICKNDVMHGFASWFDVGFEGEQPLTLATGPESQPTHWKQTVMFLPDALLVSKGEVLGCSAQLKQDPENCRRYDISMALDESDDSDSDMDDNSFADSDVIQSVDEVEQMLLEAVKS